MEHITSQFCFCELAPLYALGALSQVEREWVETQVREYPELATELADYENAAAALTYNVPDVTLDSSVKNRLFQHLSVDPPPSESSASKPHISPPISIGQIKQVDHLRWRSHIAPGIQMAILHIDKAKREMSCLVRAEAQAEYPAHRHGGVEEIMMMEGELAMGDRIFHTGDYIHSEPESIHPLAITPNGCTFFLRTSLDTQEVANV